MKKILLTILFFLLIIPIKVFAVDNIDYNVSQYTIDAWIKEDGSLDVKEYLTQTGSFNGYIRDIIYKNDSLSLFNGSIDSFKGSNIYNASNITNVKVSDASNNFQLVNSANKGDYGVYELTNYNNGISLKIYNPSMYSSKLYIIEYTLKDVIVMHNDVAELYWNFIGNEFKDDLNNVTINVYLPSSDSDKKVWVHGPLTGIVNHTNDKTVTASIDKINASNPVDVRLIFNKSMLNNVTKSSNNNALDKILAVEKARADEANHQRAIAKTIVTTMNIIIIGWIIGLIIIFIYIYNKYDKERKTTLNNKYNRQIIEDYSVGVVEYVMKKKITSNALSACILSMINKKIIKVEKTTKKNDYLLILNKIEQVKLLDYEQHLIQWMFNEIGNGKEVTLDEIKNYGKNNNTNAIDFMSQYKAWQAIIEQEAKQFNFYEDNLSIKLKSGLYSVIGIVLFILNIALTIFNPLGFIILPLAIIFIIYIILFYKRTILGNEHYSKWQAFKRFLLDFGRFSEKDLPEIILWEKYLVYATILGVADKVEKAMKIKLQQIDPNGINTMSLPIYYHMGLNSTFNTAVSSAMTNAISSSISSSASGSGGGFFIRWWLWWWRRRRRWLLSLFFYCINKKTWYNKNIIKVEYEYE
jgi:uncharacterized membrane protein